MLGTILVDQDGKTLYLFEADAMNKSNCSGGCATVWPPITMSGTATAGSGVSAKLISTTMRPDGSSQVTYAGHPLYWYEGDSNPGDTHGEGLTDFGGSWNAFRLPARRSRATTRNDLGTSWTTPSGLRPARLQALSCS
jgi:predicted lipoprotein with Yx(FWY)xxD motif